MISALAAPARLLIILVLLSATPSRADLPAPDILIYGTITLDGNPIDAAQTNVLVEARRSLDGPAIASYRIGASAPAGERYVLRIPLEELAPLRDPTRSSQVGDTILIRVTDPTGPRLETPYTIAERGEVTHLDLGATPPTGYDAWELAYQIPASSPSLDLDQDGVCNYDEYIAGTDPLDGQDKFALSIQPPDAASLIEVQLLRRPVEGPGYEGKTRFYTLQKRTHFTAEDWVSITNFGAPLTDSIPFIYREPATNGPVFFRAQVWLGPFQ